MKVKLNDRKPAERKIMALLAPNGTLLLRFNDSIRNDQRTAAIQPCNSVVNCNGTGSLETIQHSGYTPIYEGDSITITF